MDLKVGGGSVLTKIKRVNCWNGSDCNQTVSNVENALVLSDSAESLSSFVTVREGHHSLRPSLMDVWCMRLPTTHWSPPRWPERARSAYYPSVNVTLPLHASTSAPGSGSSVWLSANLLTMQQNNKASQWSGKCEWGAGESKLQHIGESTTNPNRLMILLINSCPTIHHLDSCIDFNVFLSENI